jgi:DNA-directed RNA polymerase subunit RPC12/RpoP
MPMADIRDRLRSAKEQVAELAKLAGNDQAEAARQLAAEVTEALDQAIEEASALQDRPVDARPAVPTEPSHEVVRCPWCSLRTFTFQKGTIRECADDKGAFEARYHCISCGHEAWHEID